MYSVAVRVRANYLHTSNNPHGWYYCGILNKGINIESIFTAIDIA